MTTAKLARHLRGAAKRHDVTVQALLGPKRTARLDRARAEAWQVLYNDGYTVRRIADEFSRRPSAVWRAIETTKPPNSLDLYMADRSMDRIDCVHYNASDSPDKSWRDGCLYQAARDDRPTVCKRICGKYEPMPVEMNNDIQSSCGLCADEFGAGVDV